MKRIGKYGGTECASDMLVLDVRRVRRDGNLKSGTGSGWTWKRGGDVVSCLRVQVEADRAWLIYRQRKRGGEWSDVRYPVQLDRTSFNYGGRGLGGAVRRRVVGGGWRSSLAGASSRESRYPRLLLDCELRCSLSRGAVSWGISAIDR